MSKQYLSKIILIFFLLLNPWVQASEISLIYPYFNLVQPFNPHYQSGPDCTSQAFGLGLDCRYAIQFTLNPGKYKWHGKAATEYLHIGGRNIISQRNSGGNSTNDIVTFIKKYGFLFRQKYTISGEQILDLSKYDYSNCQKLIPLMPQLYSISRNNHVKMYKIESWEQAIQALNNLEPIVIGSKVGFDPSKNQDTLLRDSDGFATPKGTWYHAWLLIGIDNRNPRPGGCLMSSSGRNWVQGPKRLNQPDGSIWVDKVILLKMLFDYNDAFAISEITIKQSLF